MSTDLLPAQRAGTFDLGGDLPVSRLGFGTMQLPGPGVWGPPRDHDEAIRVLRHAVELGVNFIDTATVVSVQNQFNLTDRSAGAVLDYCAGRGIAFIPYRPLATGVLAGPGSPLAALAAKRRATPGQLALAWLLRRSPVMLPIPGTSSVAHLEDNVRGAGVPLTDAEFADLSAIAPADA